MGLSELSVTSWVSVKQGSTVPVNGEVIHVAGSKLFSLTTKKLTLKINYPPLHIHLVHSREG